MSESRGRPTVGVGRGCASSFAQAGRGKKSSIGGWLTLYCATVSAVGLVASRVPARESPSLANRAFNFSSGCSIKR